MSVYNAENTISEAVNSILAQTYKNFEFFIINDGSTDQTKAKLNKFSDTRIRIIDQNNIGLTRSLNRGLSLASGVFIARQDADDISFKQRFEMQLDEFSSNPDLVLLGSNAIDKYESGTKNYWGYFSDLQIEKKILFSTPFPHSSVMIRRSALGKVGFYDEKMATSQDLELWMRLSKVGEISMISVPLITRSINPNSISHKRPLRQLLDATSARIKHRKNSILIVLCYSLATILLQLRPVKFVYLWFKKN